MLKLKSIISKLLVLDEDNESECIDKYILEYIEEFNKIIDEFIVENKIDGKNYEPILKVRFQYKLLSSIDPEFLINLRHGKYIYDLDSANSRLKFYKKYKKQFQLLSKRLERYWKK